MPNMTYSKEIIKAGDELIEKHQNYSKEGRKPFGTIKVWEGAAQPLNKRTAIKAAIVSCEFAISNFFADDQEALSVFNDIKRMKSYLKALL